MHDKTSARSAWTRLVLTTVFLNATAQVGPAPARATDGTVHRPVAIWPSGPLEVVAAFERPSSRAVATSLDRARTSLTSSRRVRSRIEPHRHAQSGTVRIVGARLTDDARTLILATDPHPRMARYLLPLSPVAWHPAIDTS